MQAQVIKAIVSMLTSMLTPELLRKLADMILDFAEESVLGTKSKVDDALVLPLCDMVREAFGIKDND